MTPQQQAQIARINREADERFGTKASKEKFEWRNAQRDRLGLDPEKRKRGGMSGVWDRNKQVIKPLVAGAAGALTGGAALPALLGAAMGGFDREGKSGLGFDIGGGLRGAGSGALAGAGGAAIGGATGFGGAAVDGARGMAGAKGALGNYFGMAKPAPPTTAPITPTAPGMMPAMDPGIAAQAGAAATGGAPAAAAGAPAAAGGAGWGSKALQFAQANPNVISGVAQGVGSAIGAGATRDAQMAELNFERERWEQQQLARRRMAELLSPEWTEASKRRTMPLATPEMGWTPLDYESFNPNRAR